MKYSAEIRKLKIIILLPIAILLVFVSSLSPNTVEHVYSRGIYKYLSQAISLLFAWMPFSFGEIAIIAFILFLIVASIKAIIIIIIRSGRGRNLLNYLLNIFVFISILYFSFVITWDLNYQRLPFSKISGLDVHPSTVNELYKVSEALMNHTNALRLKVKEDSKGVMKLSHKVSTIFKNAHKGYDVEAKIYPELGGMYSAPKGVIFSIVMSYMGIQGIHNPLTQEANINTEIPRCMIPSTACHEMAHQRGFAREDEANYISYLTCSKQKDVDFQYSGELLALIHCMNALYSDDRNKFNQLYKKYSLGVLRDLADNRKFWRRFEGLVENINSAINDAYLKANKQKDGEKSYGRIVDLLIAQYRKYGPKGL